MSSTLSLLWFPPLIRAIISCTNINTEGLKLARRHGTVAKHMRLTKTTNMEQKTIFISRSEVQVPGLHSLLSLAHFHTENKLPLTAAIALAL